MSAPLDLDADRLESIRARAVQGYAPTMRDTLNLVAEVERLRAESVPRSALVQVGWWQDVPYRLHRLESGHGGSRVDGCHCQPVYVIREDTDA